MAHLHTQCARLRRLHLDQKPMLNNQSTHSASLQADHKTAFAVCTNTIDLFAIVNSFY
jgi:hypothetical protein